jgi:hypothetical protein
VTGTAKASGVKKRAGSAGIGLYPVPLSSRDIDVLIGLHYLREGAEGNREHVGEPVAA